jgi:hypothetical protein
MTRIKHEPAYPNPHVQIEISAGHQVRYVIVGSVVAQL